MPRSPLLLLLFATVATARAPAPASLGVSDGDVVRLLSSQYDAKARLRGGWTARADAGATRSVCADSSTASGDRYIAVCRLGDAATPAGVDLFVLEPGATRRDRARIRARFRGITGEGDARDGGVYLMPIAPARLAFVLGASSSAAGWTHATRSLYAERDGGLRRLLTVGTQLDNRATCTPGDDRGGRRCRARRVELNCTLRADTSRAVADAWPLALQVSGERGGERVSRLVPIPHDAYGYRVSARVLATQACDGRD